MGPIPKRSFIVEPLPLQGWSYVCHIISGLVRKLPPSIVRIVLLLDLLMAINPVWGWFVYRRWSGKSLSAKEYRKIYDRGLRFAVAHLRHLGKGTGLSNVGWGTPAIRFSPARERLDYQPRGSCGECHSCCTTHWLPPAERLSCPLLEDEGCQVFGGLYWDHFNCGRYPFVPVDTCAYECPRFEGPITVQDSLPVDVGVAPLPARC